MAVEIIEFDDLPEDEITTEPMITVSMKIPTATKEMFAKIAHRERRTIGSLGAIVIEDYVNKYIEEYKKSK